MKKIKKFMAFATAAALTIGTVSVSAITYYESCEYARFQWDYSSCSIKNTTNTERYLTAYIDVYEANTGKSLGSDFDSETGAYGATATANNPATPSPDNSYRWIGAVYGGSSSYSEVVYTFDKP